MLGHARTQRCLGRSPLGWIRLICSAIADAKSVKTSSGNLHINVTGKESGPTVLFVHGLGGSAENWVPLIAATGIEATHKIVTFDFEGHGLSPLSGNGVTVDALAESVKSVLDAVDSKKAIVVGHSMGGVSRVR